jgi:hypothetical protein
MARVLSSTSIEFNTPADIIELPPPPEAGAEERLEVTGGWKPGSCADKPVPLRMSAAARSRWRFKKEAFIIKVSVKKTCLRT